MVSVSDGGTCWSGHPRELNWDALDGKILVSHNAAWDMTCYEEMVRRGQAPQIKYAAWHCTANLSAYLCNRRSLDMAVEHLFNVKLNKTVRADANGKHWPQDFSEAEQSAMLEYARGDAFWCWKIWNDYSAQWPDSERRLSKLLIDQGRRGVQIDCELLDRYILQTHDMRLRTENAIPWIRDADDDEWDEFNSKPTSTKCIAECCRKSGIPAPPVKSENPEDYEEWESTYAPKHDWIYAVSSWRSINKLYKTFLTVKERLRDDGTMPFGQRYCGTHTGRISGESKVNLFNQRKQAVLCRHDGLMENDDVKIDAAHKFKAKQGVWPEWVKYGIDFRNLIIPRPGFKMVTADLSQIEPRVAAWLAGDSAFLELVRKGFSPYQAHAMTTMGWTGGDLKEEDPKLYALAKARLLSLGYGAGFEKLIVMAKNVAGIDLTENDPEGVDVVVNPMTGETKRELGYGQNAKKVVADYRASNPKITAMWTRLDDALHRSVGTDLVLRLPSGRVLRYEKVRADVRIEPDPKTKKPRRRTVWTVCIGGKRVITYGSKLFENITQACARDVHYDGVLRLEANELSSLFGVYDEAIAEVTPDRSVTEFKQHMTVTPDWLSGCPISVDAKEVLCYTK